MTTMQVERLLGRVLFGLGVIIGTGVVAQTMPRWMILFATALIGAGSLMIEGIPETWTHQGRTLRNLRALRSGDG